jgi:hypothetical protein
MTMPTTPDICSMCGTPGSHHEVIGGYWICQGCKPEATKQYQEMLRDLDEDE